MPLSPLATEYFTPEVSADTGTASLRRPLTDNHNHVTYVFCFYNFIGNSCQTASQNPTELSTQSVSDPHVG